MKTLPVGELKSNFSSVLADVRRGHTVAVAFGRNHTPVAMLVPYSQHRDKRSGIRLGTLKGLGRCSISADFAITDDQLLNA